MKEWLPALLCAFLTGILSAWGVGGGTLLLLCMTLFLGVEQAQAQAINLLYFLPTAGVSLLLYRRDGIPQRDAIRRCAPVGTLCAAAAALLAVWIDPAPLRRPFGLFLAFTGVSMLLQKEKKANPNAFDRRS